MQQRDLFVHLVAATFAVAAGVAGHPYPAFVVAMFYAGVLVRRHR